MGDDPRQLTTDAKTKQVGRGMRRSTDDTTTEAGRMRSTVVVYGGRLTVENRKRKYRNNTYWRGTTEENKAKKIVNRNDKDRGENDGRKVWN